MPEIELNEATHEYRVDGRPAPSVTRILKSAGLIDERWSSDGSLRRGSYAHAALEFYDQGDLDETTLDPGLLPYLEAWKKFRAELPFEILAVEERIVHPIYLYAGTLDRRVRLKHGGQQAIVDLKTGAPAVWHPLQTAGYAMPFVDPTRRFAVYLNGDGKYDLKEHKDRTDYDVFKAFLTGHFWKKRNGL